VGNEIIVRNGFVFDPANGIDGERMDVFVRDSKIVDKVDESTAKKIDASGMIVMAGGVDIHNLAQRCIQPHRWLKGKRRQGPKTGRPRQGR